MALEQARQRDVLHQRDLRISTDAAEQVVADEHRLVAGRDAGPARAQVHHGLDDAHQGPGTVDADIEAAPCEGPERCAAHQRIGVLRQRGIGVQEQQHIGRAGRGAGVHLGGSPARREQREVGMSPCHGQGVVLAAAVDHDEAHAASAKALQFTQTRGQRLGLVEHRHDDAECRSHAASGRLAAAAPAGKAACPATSCQVSARWSKPAASVGLTTAK